MKRKYINDTFELHKNYIVYNGVKFEDIIIKDNGPKNYNELLESRMKPYNFMDKDDIAHMIFILSKNSETGEYDICELGLLYTDKGCLYVETGHSSLCTVQRIAS